MLGKVQRTLGSLVCMRVKPSEPSGAINSGR